MFFTVYKSETKRMFPRREPLPAAEIRRMFTGQLISYMMDETIYIRSQLEHVMDRAYDNYGTTIASRRIVPGSGGVPVIDNTRLDRDVGYYRNRARRMLEIPVPPRIAQAQDLKQELRQALDVCFETLEEDPYHVYMFERL